MTKIQIQTSLSPVAALANGCLEHGHILVAPTTEQIAALTPEQRTELARYVAPTDVPDRFRWDATLAVTSNGWAGVLAGLEIARVERERKATEQAEQTRLAEQRTAARNAEARQAAAVAISNPATLILGDQVINGLSHVDLGDLQAPYDAARKAAREMLDACQATVAAEAAAEIERREVDPRAWCAEHGAALSEPLQRAAREGRRVRSELTRLVYGHASIAIKALAASLGCELATSYAEQVRDGVPTTEAYAVLDACARERKRLARACLIPGVEITIGPIARHDVAERGLAVWRTGVDFAISHPWLDDSRGWVVLAEPLDEETDDE